MTDLILFWHRRDLRLTDNRGLAIAREESPKVVGVFCLDPQILQAEDIAAVRVVYLLGCLRDLQQRYQAVGSRLLVLHQAPVTSLPALAQALGAKAVYWNLDVEPYARQRDDQLRSALKAIGVQVKAGWDQLLHAPGEILTQAQEPYSVYTPFWRNWQKQAKADPFPALTNAVDLTPAEVETAQAMGAIALPSAEALGFTWDNDLLLAPGETAAQERLAEFCEGDQGLHRDRGLWAYDEQRNLPFAPGTSRLSPAVKFGAIGIRQVWQAAASAYSRSRSDEDRHNIQTWMQELAWREFYQHALYFFPTLATGPYRPAFQYFPWENNPTLFQAWCAGKTGYPIVDAAMRQLNETGWMHNRCRMIVASFLTKDLIVDWRWGEKYFMQHLIDGDLAANNGGWQWSASSGLDPKPLRIFNPASQAQKFDPEAEYIRTWLPELRRVDTVDLITGNIDDNTRDRYDYPAPIVDHKTQQQRFKSLYAAQKSS